MPLLIYIAGATAWAGWKVRFDELQAQTNLSLSIQRQCTTDAQERCERMIRQRNDLQAQAQCMADALDELNKVIDKTWNECNTKSIPDKYKKEISAAQALSCSTLQQFKDGKEVGEPADDVCCCILPNWNAFTGKCLTCGKQ